MSIYSSSSRYKLEADRRTAFRGNPVSANYSLYTVREGDTLERIAARLLGSTERYWELADLNPQIKFPLDIRVGSTIRIPV